MTESPIGALWISDYVSIRIGANSKVNQFDILLWYNVAIYNLSIQYVSFMYIETYLHMAT